MKFWLEKGGMKQPRFPMWLNFDAWFLWKSCLELLRMNSRMVGSRSDVRYLKVFVSDV